MAPFIENANEDDDKNLNFHEFMHLYKKLAQQM